MLRLQRPPGEDAAPAITVVVCTWRRYGLLAECLRSLNGQTLAPGRREILVIDNSGAGQGGDGFPWPDGVRRIDTPRPGLSHARNLGVSMARGQIIAFIDDDAVASPDWLDAIFTAFRDAPEAVVVGGPVAPAWQGARPDWVGDWHLGFFSIVDRGNEARPLGADEWLAGTNIAFRAEALREFGPFPYHLGRISDVLLGNEEIAVVARIRAAGLGVRYDPRVRVRHVVHADRLAQSWLRRRVTWQAISDLLLDPPNPNEGMGALWRRVSTYLERLPPAYRGFPGLLRDETEPDMSRAQSEAIAAMIRILALHGTSLDAGLGKAVE